MKEANRRNLNDEFLRADERYYDLSPLADPTTEATGVTVRAYFREIERHLLGHIGEADVVVGCVAWLTSQQVLRALSQKKGVSIIVQKEDFLRPDYVRPTAKTGAGTCGSYMAVSLQPLAAGTRR